MQMEAQIEAQKMQMKNQLEIQLETAKHEFRKEIEMIKAQATLGFQNRRPRVQRKARSSQGGQKGRPYQEGVWNRAKANSSPQRQGKRGEMTEPVEGSEGSQDIDEILGIRNG